MDYIVTTLEGKTGVQNNVHHLCDNLKDKDRLFIFECDNVPYENSPLRYVPDWNNIHKITLNEFPFKTFLQYIEHYHIDSHVIEAEPKYNLCMLNQRPAAMRVIAMKHAEYWPNFVGTMNSERFIDYNKPYINTYQCKDGICRIDDIVYDHDQDLSYYYNIPSKMLTETSTALTRLKVDVSKYGMEFENSLIPPDEWFESRCDLFHEGDQEFSEKLAKAFYFKKPFLSLGEEQRFAMRRFGFEDYFEIGSYYDHVMPLARDLCRNGVPDFTDKIEHNYNLTMDLFWKYGDLTQFILNLELNNNVLEDTGWLMDEYMKLLESVPCKKLAS